MWLCECAVGLHNCCVVWCLPPDFLFFLHFQGLKSLDRVIFLDFLSGVVEVVVTVIFSLVFPSSSWVVSVPYMIWLSSHTADQSESKQKTLLINGPIHNKLCCRLFRSLYHSWIFSFQLSFQFPVQLAKKEFNFVCFSILCCFNSILKEWYWVWHHLVFSSSKKVKVGI